MVRRSPPTAVSKPPRKKSVMISSPWLSSSRNQNLGSWSQETCIEKSSRRVWNLYVASDEADILFSSYEISVVRRLSYLNIGIRLRPGGRQARRGDQSRTSADLNEPDHRSLTHFAWC